jgi:hypothetical protein
LIICPQTVKDARTPSLTGIVDNGRSLCAIAGEGRILSRRYWPDFGLTSSCNSPAHIDIRFSDCGARPEESPLALFQ